MLKRGEQGTCRGPVEVVVSIFKQCVTLSLSHTLSHIHTHTHTHTRTGEMLERREKALLSTPFARAVLQTSRERLNSSSGADSDAFFESSACIHAPDHTSRRCSKTSKDLKQTLKRCKTQAYVIKALWGVRTKINLGHGIDRSRMKFRNLSLFRSHSSDPSV